MRLRTIQEVEQILQARNRVANDRDLLHNLLRFISEKIARFEGVCTKRHSRSLRKKIKRFKSIEKFLREAIDAASNLLKSPDEKVRKSFLSTFTFFTRKIQLLQNVSHIFSHKFRGIYVAWRDMIANAGEFKNLVAA